MVEENKSSAQHLREELQGQEEVSGPDIIDVAITISHYLRTALFWTTALLLGSAGGWYVAHTLEKHETTKLVEHMVEGTESSDAASAARAVRAISLIASGDTNGAIRSLSVPIAHYYVLYGSSVSEDQRRADLSALIEKLIRTNVTVADAVKERIELNRLTATPGELTR